MAAGHLQGHRHAVQLLWASLLCARKAHGSPAGRPRHLVAERSVTTDVNTREVDYPGWRIRFEASLGNARVTMQVDVGIGDVVYPTPIWIDYAVLLDHPAPHLRGLERGAVSNCPARDGPVAVVSRARKTPGSRQITDYVPSAGRRPAQWAWLVRSAKSKGVVGGGPGPRGVS